MPFFGATLAVVLYSAEPARQAAAELILLVYAAVILSFVGGVRWGAEIAAATFTAPRWSVLSISVLGAIAGWVLVVYSVLGHQAAWLFAVAGVLHALHWAWDVTIKRDLPAWYDGLRTLASAGAVACLAVAYGAAAFSSGFAG